jgi:RNA polymerase sigma-70 factor (ECF subfamily)
MDLGPSQRTAEVVLGAPHPEDTWVEPIADWRVIDRSQDPADVVAARESIRMAFVAALQYLPARQRAALILCDVLRWPATDAAALLDTSVASINSALQRARVTLAEHRHDELDGDLDDDRRVLLARYVDAFERYDTDTLASLMRDDVVLSMPPYDVWLQGPEELVAWFLGQGIGCRGSRLVPIAVSGVTGFGSYRPAADGTPGKWEPFAIQIVDTVDGRIVGHHNFLSPQRFAEFGLPAVLIEPGRA